MTTTIIAVDEKFPTVFVPFLGDFFSISYVDEETAYDAIVFVPFLGDFFSIAIMATIEKSAGCFRPLSRGLFFNARCKSRFHRRERVFVPFLGDFFSIHYNCYDYRSP